ncbi:glycosyl transferase family 2 [Methanococcus vannielii SB]|jgi:glycosyltransferase involved in cell wall biosynthesis|uniref:Glycosyl transferase family 2 n=1 Tax=Methanococcus vannielii (strain ATCC 35089 / DSM 1224 / JCM 13029 / OCM 148 / SB) TaxID=406327 RepID=A6UP88_METVS|nr:glycosyltransferase [Methanococcus vannielii]ABR54310.1 glycosyl transferase family 2 [Methanococcus vannielii SB]
MNEKPLISVLMPNYNNEKYLAEAIESILNQTYGNFEFIIIDDCSTDDSWSIIQDYAKKDKRIMAFRNERNLGRPKTYNRLLELISNESFFFFFMGSDDVLKENMIDVKIRYFNNFKEVDGVGNSIEYVDENLNFIKKREYPEKKEDIKKNFLIFNPISQGGMCLKSYLKAEKFNEDYKVCLDYEIWTRLIDKGYVFENLKESYYLYRQQKEQAKQKNLKLTLINTVKIKSKYIFKPKYFSIKSFLRFNLEILLIFPPKRLILWVFYKTL